jgi:hypothetical protein
MRDLQPDADDTMRDDIDVRGLIPADLFDPCDCDDDECARLVAEGRLRATTTDLA